MNCILEVVVAGIGTALFWRGAFVLHRLKRARSWNTTPANIIETSLASGSELLRYGEVLEFFYPHAIYEYQVDGVRYRSERTALEKKALWMEDCDEAQNLLDQIIAAPTVFYNPDDTEEAILIPALSKRRMSHNLALIVAGAMLMILGLCFCWVKSL